MHAAGLAKQAKRRASVVLQKVTDKLLEGQAAANASSSGSHSVAVGYVRIWDDNYNLPFYVHEATGDSFWEVPHNKAEQ